MRIEVSKGDFKKVIEVPADVDMASVMMWGNGQMQWAIMHFKAEGISRQEEVLFDDGSKQLVALYYRAPELAEMMQAFVGFEEMIHVEVQADGWLIRMIV
ncbi:MAG: hypothetical protein IJF08_00830 [Clostridia bacterium]|nr:hypothetical protein [Clostridia bacterium]